MKNLKIGDNVSFGNNSINVKDAIVIDILEKGIFKEINGEKIRYILELDGFKYICSPSEIID